MHEHDEPIIRRYMERIGSGDGLVLYAAELWKIPENGRRYASQALGRKIRELLDGIN